MDSLDGQFKNRLAEIIFSSASMLLAEIIVRCGLASSVRPSVRPSIWAASICQVDYLWDYNTYLVLISRVRCSSQYAQMILEFRKKKFKFLQNFLIFINIGPDGSEISKLLLLQFLNFCKRTFATDSWWWSP